MELTKQQIEQVRELFSKYAKENYLKNESKDNSEYSDEIYTDYQDIIYIEEFVLDNSRLSKQEVLDKLWENFYDYDTDFFNNQHYFDEFIKEYESELEDIKKDLSTDFYDYNSYNDVIILNSYIDYESIVNQVKLPVNIVLENYDAFDMEFSNNNFYNIFYNVDYENQEDVQELFEELEESSLNELLTKQNYTLKQFVEYLKDNHNDRKNILQNDKVFQSIIQEIENAFNYVALTVCREMTFEELEKLKQSESITINKNDVIGYHGFVDGSGSVFEIKLNNDMEYKTKDINIHIDCSYGYGLSEVYGGHLAS
ncbi:hypothetical protein [Mammaliicoccus sciuri]|uniref:hypothetical protein n=1 Tax=Mammaliicoccus sciuri TaxID=1296 RepID=UPI002B260B43|nr:hypothetical protein [Mammaliicoccus sciuri]WQK75188.1 hypothetical protein P3U33_05520 [Mammaliicoccus sciuri]